MTKGVPLLYNVNIMNKTITTTNKSKSLNTKRSKSQSEEDAIIKAVCTLVALLLGFFIASCIVSAVPGPILGLLLFFFFFFGGWMLL